MTDPKTPLRQPLTLACGIEQQLTSNGLTVTRVSVDNFLGDVSIFVDLAGPVEDLDKALSVLGLADDLDKRALTGRELSTSRMDFLGVDLWLRVRFPRSEAAS